MSISFSPLFSVGVCSSGIRSPRCRFLLLGLGVDPFWKGFVNQGTK